MTVGAVKRVIGGVAARKTILRQLLDGPQTGLSLRAAIARRVEKPVEEISDAMLYFNLQHLENHGLIERFRDGKEKAARIVPQQVQSVRRVLAVEAPVAYLGGISQDPGVLTGVPKRIRAETPYRPVKFHYFLEPITVRRLSGVTADRELHEVPATILNEDLEQMYALVRKVATDLIQEYALLVDLTGASKVCALALFRLAHDFDLPCIHVPELGAISWLHH